MRRGDQFILEFNKLEELLRKKADKTEHLSFSELVDTVADQDPTVKKYRKILKAIGRLRNAIVHDPEYPNSIIADPRPEIVEQLIAIRQAIESPEKLIPKFQKPVRVFSVTEPLVECLNFMKEHDYSQVVVIRDNKYLLLSTEGIARWLGSAQSVGLADLENTTVGDALEFEADNICLYMSRNDTIDAAIEAFKEALTKGIPRLQAILITEHGKSTEKPLGIITAWDLIELVK